MVIGKKKENFCLTKKSKQISSKHTNIILETKDVSIGYSQKKTKNCISKNISVSVKKGSFVVIIGKNGIGKSTFLKTISGVLQPLEGFVTIQQKNIEEYNALELATNLSLVLTERLPESQLTVFELVALGRQPYTNWIDQLSTKDIKIINWAITETEIEHLQHKRFYELSDGQLQRVLIARALAQDTPIIILDEPTAYLDLYGTIKIMKLLKKLVKKTKKTIVLSSHEINLSIQLADEIMLFKENDVVFGTPKELIEKKAFESLFPSGSVEFNTDLKQFIIQTK